MQGEPKRKDGTWKRRERKREKDMKREEESERGRDSASVHGIQKGTES